MNTPQKEWFLYALSEAFSKSRVRYDNDLVTSNLFVRVLYSVFVRKRDTLTIHVTES